MYALDIETRPTVETDLPFALEPYRVLTSQSKISSIAVYGPEYEVQIHERMDDFEDQLLRLIQDLNGKEVYCHKAVFDVSYLIATIGSEVCRPVKWRDSAILNKWIINGEVASAKNLSFSLKECIKRAKLEDPELEEYLDIKYQDVKAGEDWDYWLKRGRMDAKFTWLLVDKLLTYFKWPMNGFIVTCNTIFPISVGYVEGIPIDTEVLNIYKKECLNRQREILSTLNFSGSVITSTKQLANLLFNEWNLSPVAWTPKGAPSVNLESLLRLQQSSKDPRFAKVMEYKKIATMLSKYVNGFETSMDYIGTNRIHGSPKILSTITGRMTYGSKIFKKYPTSIAMHQLPRKEKTIKKCMVAPPGYQILYMDASAQEGRVMAIVANERTMINAYCKGIDLHSDLTEEIFGTPYDRVVEANKLGEGEVYEQRQAGKLTGLSSFYRIGAKALSAKFFATYEYDISIQTAMSYLKAFKTKYSGVVEYWSDSIGWAKSKGYAEAWGGFRYRIKTMDWKGESSAINHPIQGGGAMMTYAAIALISKRFPELILVSQVHDSICYFVPIGYDWKSVIEYVSTYDYGKLLGFEQTVPLVFDGWIGDNFAGEKK